MCRDIVAVLGRLMGVPEGFCINATVIAQMAYHLTHKYTDEWELRVYYVYGGG